MPSDIEKLHAKLAELRRRDPQLRVFGTSTHHYLLNPCLSEHEVQEAEAHYGISLPEDYRRFLLFMGNGGTGPAYGILPLEASLAQSVHDARFLRLPFPHVQAWNIKPQDVGLVRDRDYAAFDEVYGSDAFAPGALQVCHEGDRYYVLLVILGEERGHMWWDGRTSDGGIHPVIDPQHPGRRLSFFTWYEFWLDRSLAEVG